MFSRVLATDHGVSRQSCVAYVNVMPASPKAVPLL